MTHAKQLVKRWIDDPATCYSLEDWAKEIDPRCRVDGFLYSSYTKIVFSDCSQALFAGGKLEVLK